jgi:CubicO group peptidase (beta-lactamase class C family)
MRALFLLLVLAPQEKPRDLGAILKPIREKHKLPGMVAAVVTGAGVEAIGVDGLRKLGAEERLETGDLFHLGSCTKSMTATMIATLVEEKKLDWTTTVGEVFKDVAMHDDWKAVTLEQLLTNRSGAPANLDADGLWGALWKIAGDDPRKQRRALVEGVLKNEPEGEPGTKFIYSNAGFSIAGAMAEKVTGEAWETLMKKRLFEPLGMTSAGFGAPGSKEKIDQPRGHAGGKGVEPGLQADNPAAIGPAGIVHCSFADWAKYVALHLRFDEAGSKKADPAMEKLLKTVKAETLSRLHDVPKGAETKYAMGWMVAERKWADGRVLTHNGSNTMWFCVAWLAPKKDFAVLVGTNAGGDAASKACDDAATALILGRGK